MAGRLVFVSLLAIALTEVQWGNNQGEDQWEDTCSVGKAQSPININDTDITKEWRGDLKFDYSPMHAGHYVSGFGVVYIIGGLQGTLTASLDAANVSEKDFFSQGILVHSPSEHTRNGQHYDLELQIFHTTNEDDTFPYSDDAANISFLFKQGNHNEFLQQIINSGTIDINNLFQDDKLQQFFVYKGSFTVPPCQEEVYWFIWDDIKEASSEQITFFKQHQENNDNIAKSKAIQDIGDRQIWYHGDYYIQDSIISTNQIDSSRIFSAPPIIWDTPRAILLAVQVPTDTVLDYEGPLLMSKIPHVWLRMQKMEFETEAIEAATFKSAEKNIARAANTLLPQSEITVVGLACTSMSMTLGPERVAKQLGGAYRKTTNMAIAQATAIQALGVTKVALVTPYIEEIAAKNVNMLREAGLDVVSHATMGLRFDKLTDKVSKESLREWALAVDCEEAEAVVIGCSAMRACEPGWIDSLEEALGKPVVTSTQAFLWKMLRVAGIEDQIDGYGTLFKNH